MVLGSKPLRAIFILCWLLYSTKLFSWIFVSDVHSWRVMSASESYSGTPGSSSYRASRFSDHDLLGSKSAFVESCLFEFFEWSALAERLIDKLPNGWDWEGNSRKQIKTFHFLFAFSLWNVANWLILRHCNKNYWWIMHGHQSKGCMLQIYYIFIQNYHS